MSVFPALVGFTKFLAAERTSIRKAGHRISRIEPHHVRRQLIAFLRESALK